MKSLSEYSVFVFRVTGAATEYSVIVAKSMIVSALTY